MDSSPSDRLAAGDYFDVLLVDLGERDPRYAGILTPIQELHEEKVGVTKQFLDDAQIYHENYSVSEHYRAFFEMGFAQAGVGVPGEPLILDIGSGSGSNSIIPCLSLFPGCRIIGTDISPQLLALLNRYIRQERLGDRVVCVCTDAMQNFLRPNCFDVVTGSAILHHLMDPERALASAHRALKSGGTAIFFEPFEGFGVLGLAYRNIIDLGRDRFVLPPKTETVLKALVFDFETRKGTDKSAAHFRIMDDKWLFTHHYLERVSLKIGFRRLKIIPHRPPINDFRNATGNFLGHCGLKMADLPDWGWEIIDMYDAQFSPEMKADMPLEATIVLQK